MRRMPISPVTIRPINNPAIISHRAATEIAISTRAIARVRLYDGR